MHIIHGGFKLKVFEVQDCLKLNQIAMNEGLPLKVHN